MFAILAAIGAVALIVILSTRTAAATMNAETAQTLDEIFRKWGNRYGVDPVLLKAIATVESSLNPDAENPSDPSVGLMQILCIPDATGKCSNTFNVEGWDAATWKNLHDPDFNVQIGAQILAWNLKNFGYPRGIAVYNAWNARHAPMNGPFPNQAYVEKVIAAFTRLAA
jgi:soluble lytic murein transglycosylase-like protein